MLKQGVEQVFLTMEPLASDFEQLQTARSEQIRSEQQRFETSLARLFQDFRACLREAVAQPHTKEILQRHTGDGSVTFGSIHHLYSIKPNKLEAEIREPVFDFGNWRLTLASRRDCLGEMHRGLERLGQTEPPRRWAHQPLLAQIAKEELAPFKTSVSIDALEIRLSMSWLEQ